MKNELNFSCNNSFLSNFLHGILCIQTHGRHTTQSFGRLTFLVSYSYRGLNFKLPPTSLIKLTSWIYILWGLASLILFTFKYILLTYINLGRLNFGFTMFYPIYKICVFSKVYVFIAMLSNNNVIDFVILKDCFVIWMISHYC